MENLQFPVREYLNLSQRLLDELAVAKLEMVGLDASVCDKFPSELSGGMTKRVALARALALDPEIVFLDEPTSGLDPIGAGDFDTLIATLQRTLGLTVFMVTHDLDSLHTVCDRIAVLADGKVIAAGTMDTMLASEHPWLQAYFHGKRARAGRRRTTRRRDGLARSRSMETRANYVVIGCVHAGRRGRRVRLRLLVPEHRRHRRARLLPRACSTVRCPACAPAPRCCSTASASAR